MSKQTSRYNQCDTYMKAYAAAIEKHHFLSITDGTVLRSDGSPVPSVCLFDSRWRPWDISWRTVLRWFYLSTLFGTTTVQLSLSTTHSVRRPWRTCCILLSTRTIVEEAELKSVLCTPASGLMLLNCLNTDLHRFKSLANLIIVSLVSLFYV